VGVGVDPVLEAELIERGGGRMVVRWPSGSCSTSAWKRSSAAMASSQSALGTAGGWPSGKPWKKPAKVQRVLANTSTVSPSWGESKRRMP
jgi:hypothetical protein